MRKSLNSALTHTLGNAIGLTLAMLLLPGFKISISAFVVAVLLFTVLQLLLNPLILKLSKKTLPALEGGIALVTTFTGLLITSLLISGMQIGGLSNWLLGTLLVWVGALISGVILPRYFSSASRTGE